MIQTAAVTTLRMVLAVACRPAVAKIRTVPSVGVLCSKSTTYVCACAPSPVLWGLVLTYVLWYQIVTSADGRGAHKLPSTMFEIPVLPRGRHLLMNILSTWGDPYYVGLMGFEVFDGAGHPVAISDPDRQIWADPPDINVLPDYNGDPRTVDKLVDSHNFTCDDLHAWLAPFRRGNVR